MLLTKKKLLLKNPEHFRVELVRLLKEDRSGTGEASATSDEALLSVFDQAWMQALQSQLSEHGKHTAQKQQISRKIGPLKKAGESAEKELAAMRELSERLQVLDAEIEASLSSGDEMLARQAGSGEHTEEEPETPLFMHYKSVATGPDEINNELLVTTDFKDNEWDDYVASHPANHLYHDLRWRHVIESSLGQKTVYLVSRKTDGAICGVLPLVQMESALFGKFLVSLPYVNYGGPLADNKDIEKILLDKAAAIASEQQLEHVETREFEPREGLEQKTNKVSMVLKLPTSGDALLSGLGSKLRSQANRAARAGATSCHGGTELLDGFYKVFSVNMRDLGTPVYSKQFFRTMLEAFPDKATIHLVELDGQPVAAGFLFAHNDTVEIPWASSLRKHNNLSVNMMLYRNVLEWSIANGYRYFDFGRSSVDGPTYRFKQQWGAKPVQQYWHYCLEEGQSLPALNPDNPKYALFIGVWKRLPVFISNAIGPHIIKNLPS